MRLSAAYRWINSSFNTKCVHRTQWNDLHPFFSCTEPFLSLSLRWKSCLLWFSCLLGACVKYSCFSICLLVFYLSFFPFDVPSVKESFYGSFFFKYLLEVLLSTEDNYSVLLFIILSPPLESTELYIPWSVLCTSFKLFCLILHFQIEIHKPPNDMVPLWKEPRFWFQIFRPC